MNKEQEHCPLCGASEENFISDPRTASLICDQCGCVVIERIPDLGQEWTEYEGQETSLRRTGCCTCCLARNCRAGEVGSYVAEREQPGPLPAS